MCKIDILIWFHANVVRAFSVNENERDLSTSGARQFRPDIDQFEQFKPPEIAYILTMFSILIVDTLTFLPFNNGYCAIFVDFQTI